MGSIMPTVVILFFLLKGGRLLRGSESAFQSANSGRESISRYAAE